MNELTGSSDSEPARQSLCCGAIERLRKLAPLLAEINRRAEKAGAEESPVWFTVEIDPELWAEVGPDCY